MNQGIAKYESLSVSDGSTMNAYVAHPKDAHNLPAVLVFQEAFGVNAHIRSVTERIAQEGYYAIAPELFHRSGSGFEGSYTDFAAVRPHMEALTREGLEADILATYAWVQHQAGLVQTDKVVSVGFCMGGRVSVHASTLLPLKAAASFYGGGIMDTIADRIEKVQAPLMLCWGGLDQHITQEKIQPLLQALDAHKKSYIHSVFSHADHGFFCDARQSYQPNAAQTAWAMLKAFWASYLN